MPAGYSGTPLARKLGIKPGFRVAAVDAPSNYRKLLSPMPDDVQIVEGVSRSTDLIHLFVTRKARLQKALLAYLKNASGAVIWVSWPKKSSKVETDISEDTIRALALPMGLVDVKVCAVDETWSGLKLVLRKELRPSQSKRSAR
jgi:hypothetical protein